MKTRKLLTTVLLLLAFVVGSPESASASTAPAFSSPPTVSKVGGNTVIEFAVDRPTDVAVTIEDAKGHIVRHLVAGVLGDHPPAPLKPGLVQRIEWDGKADYGKVAGDGPFQVRVGLGLKAEFDRIVMGGKPDVRAVHGLGVGPDGTLYVNNVSGGAVWGTPQILAFNRDGSFQRAVTPFTSHLSKEHLRGIDTVTVDGQLVPRIVDEKLGLSPRIRTPRSSTIQVSKDGETLYLPCSETGRAHAPPGIGILNRWGGCDEAQFYVPCGFTGKQPIFGDFASLAISSDGRFAYISGVKSGKYDKTSVPAVFRVPLNQRDQHETFFGDPEKAGHDPAHLGNQLRGLAVDGKGRLYIADHANDRVVVVDERSRKVLGQIEVAKPDFVFPGRDANGLYVSSLDGTTVTIHKFDDWSTGKVVGSTSFKAHRREYCLAVDTSAEPVVLWGADRLGNLVRIEETDKRFVSPTVVSRTAASYQGSTEAYLGVVSDRDRGEVYVRSGESGIIWHRFREKTGEIERLEIGSGPIGAIGGGRGYQLLPHPNGNLYGLAWPYNFLQWDRRGKPLAFLHPLDPSEHQIATHSQYRGKPMPKNSVEKVRKNKAMSFVPVGMINQPHTLGIRPADGGLFIFHSKRRGRYPKSLYQYSPEGTRISKDPVIWKVSDAAVGPKFDAQGNIYVAEIVTPQGWKFPKELEGQLGEGKQATKRERFLANNYGSIVKFPPSGGTFDFGKSKHHAVHLPPEHAIEPKLPADLKKLPAEFHFRSSVDPATVIGAEWIHPGISHLGPFRCNCENTTFEVDPFGRVYFIDSQRYRVRVIDTNGNALTHFGRYGNATSQPPGTDASQQEIALAWPTGVAVTDRYAYIGDSLNRRLIRVRLGYAEEASSKIP